LFFAARLCRSIRNGASFAPDDEDALLREVDEHAEDLAQALIERLFKEDLIFPFFGLA
jgi:hypothetical protein